MSEIQAGQHTDFRGDLIHWLNRELKQFAQALGAADQAKLRTLRSELDNIIGFVETLELIHETLPFERFQDSLRNSIRTIKKFCENIPRDVLQCLPNIPLNKQSGLPQFLHDAFQRIGPRSRLSGNGMSLWVTIDALDAGFFDGASIQEWLQASGFTHGMDEATLQTLFDEQLF